MPRSLPLLLCCLALADPAAGIVIRHDRTEAEAMALAGLPAFAGVGRTQYGTGLFGSGTLIAPEWVLTAAHVIHPALAGSFMLDGVTYPVAAFHLHPQYNLETPQDGYDIALLRLAEPITHITPAMLFTGPSELGLRCTMVGYGLSGTGLSGWQIGTDGVKRAAQNIIDAHGSAIGRPDRLLMTDFDNPLNAGDNWIGSPEPEFFEGNTGPGDSGGGLFALVDGQWQLAGVHHATAYRAGPSGGYGNGQLSVRVTVHQEWIAATIPAPGTALILLVPAAGAARRRRSRWPRTCAPATSPQGT